MVASADIFYDPIISSLAWLPKDRHVTQQDTSGVVLWLSDIPVRPMPFHSSMIGSEAAAQVNPKFENYKATPSGQYNNLESGGRLPFFASRLVTFASDAPPS